MTTPPRELDVVLVGATGFVGRLTARHLAEHAPDGVRIALAGRSPERLEALAASLPGTASSWPLLVVDTTDEAAVADLAARTRVVASTVGPYAKYGTALAAACASSGTHYCDLTGEVLFVHDSIARNHEVAQATGARIVHACGYDSVPSDLGVLLTVAAARADGHTLARTRLAVVSAKGGISGGTIDSARHEALVRREDPGAARVLADPEALSDGPRVPRSPRSPRPARTDGPAGGPAALLGAATRAVRAAVPVRRDPETGRFTGLFVMAGFNTRVVRRSASLLGYGDAFRYGEHVAYGTGPVGALTATVTSAGLVAALAGLSFGPTRALLDRVLPAPGEGPSEEAMAGGRFRMVVTAETVDGPTYRTTFGAPYDPGYGGTAVMFGQAALALALDDGLPPAAGVLTPATGIGEVLADRLRAHGFTVRTERLDRAPAAAAGAPS